MIQLFLWPVFALWMGLAFVVGAVILGTFAWCSVHLLRDVVVGAKGQIWCPAMKRELRVTGIPRGSLVGAPFVALSRCERFGSRPIGCAKQCLLA